MTPADNFRIVKIVLIKILLIDTYIVVFTSFPIFVGKGKSWDVVLDRKLKKLIFGCLLSPVFFHQHIVLQITVLYYHMSDLLVRLILAFNVWEASPF